MSNSSIWPIDRTLSTATTLDQSGSESNGNEEVLHIPQSSSITGASLLDCLVSYPGHLLWGSYPSAEMQSVYSTATTDWALILEMNFLFKKQQKIYRVKPVDYGEWAFAQSCVFPRTFCSKSIETSFLIFFFKIAQTTLCFNNRSWQYLNTITII